MKRMISVKQVKSTLVGTIAGAFGFIIALI
jgi:hypothetical protein